MVSSNNIPVQAPPRSLKRLLLMFALLLAFGGGGAMLINGYQYFVAYMFTSVESQKTLIVLFERLTHSVFGILSIASLIILVIVDFIAVDILYRPKSKRIVRFQNWCCGGLVLGILLMLFGGFLVNPLWYDRLEQAGYKLCTNNVFLLSKSFTSSAWVRNPAWCYDEGMSRILKKNHSYSGFDEAARYLQAKYVTPAQDAGE